MLNLVFHHATAHLSGQSLLLLASEFGEVRLPVYLSAIQLTINVVLQTHLSDPTRRVKHYNRRMSLLGTRFMLYEAEKALTLCMFHCMV